MGKVIADQLVSLDGFSAGPNVGMRDGGEAATHLDLFRERPDGAGRRGHRGPQELIAGAGYVVVGPTTFQHSLDATNEREPLRGSAVHPTLLCSTLVTRMVTLQFVGSGDAFGSGGRLQTCMSLRTASAHVLLDCGTSSLIGLARLGLAPTSIDAVLVSHLHGDHFGGIPFLVLDQQFTHRERPLVLVGPPGLRHRVMQAMEVLFPGSSQVKRRFDLQTIELSERISTAVVALEVMGYPVTHASGAQSYGLRVVCDNKIVAYSGDTEWTDELIQLADGADLFICEAYVFEKSVKNHLSYATLAQHRSRLGCRRLVLTHMSADMLNRRGEVEAELADDGLTLTI